MLWCVCRGEDNGSEMVACGGEACSVKWFHVACLKDLKRKNNWVCSDCLEAPAEDRESLVASWREQQRLRRKGEWSPSKELTTPPSKKRPKKKRLSPEEEQLSSSELKAMTKTALREAATGLCDEDGVASDELAFGRVTRDIAANDAALEAAYRACASILPHDDVEAVEVVKLAHSYYEYWRPSKTKVILLAESHVYTSLADSKVKFRKPESYDGPDQYVALVYCLGYGENELLEGSLSNANKGTPQFWECLAAAANLDDRASVLKRVTKDLQERLKIKHQLLKKLQADGIWLLDASVVGWYLPQQTEYQRGGNGDVHKLSKSRPPKACKKPALALSWELFIKHLIKEEANKGHLRALLLIGKEVENIITQQSFKGAVSSETIVYDALPAPNAWIQGGYGPSFDEIARICRDNALQEDDKNGKKK